MFLQCMGRGLGLGSLGLRLRIWRALKCCTTSFKKWLLCGFPLTGHFLQTGMMDKSAARSPDASSLDSEPNKF